MSLSYRGDSERMMCAKLSRHRDETPTKHWPGLSEFQHTVGLCIGEAMLLLCLALLRFRYSLDSALLGFWGRI